MSKMLNKLIRSRLAANLIDTCLLSKQSTRWPRSNVFRSYCVSSSISTLNQISHSQEQPREKNIIRDQIIQKIEATGPLTVAEYMKIVLTSPISGFYMKQDVFGSKGHFTTSPEISQIFGELIGVWLVNEWQRFNCNKPFRIIELGPGRGTLSYDISRVLSQFSHTQEAASLHLIEISPYLRQVQEQTLCGHVCVQETDFMGTHNSLTKTGFPVTWYSSIDQLLVKPGFSVFIAHEFLDALPIHKFQKNEKGQWREVLISSNQNKELCLVQSREATPASKLLIPEDYKGDHLEVCPEATLIVDKIVKRINDNEGCFLMCDYGYDDEATRNSDTFRAFRENTLWDPLKEPGTADLTADVDFGHLKRTFQDKALVFGPVDQDNFLQNLGIHMRLEKLLQSADEMQAKDLKSGVNMIMESMGKRFKFMSMFSRHSADKFRNDPPAGFD